MFIRFLLPQCWLYAAFRLLWSVFGVHHHCVCLSEWNGLGGRRSACLFFFFFLFLVFLFACFFSCFPNLFKPNDMSVENSANEFSFITFCVVCSWLYSRAAHSKGKVLSVASHALGKNKYCWITIASATEIKTRKCASGCGQRLESIARQRLRCFSRNCWPFSEDNFYVRTDVAPHRLLPIHRRHSRAIRLDGSIGRILTASWINLCHLWEKGKHIFQIKYS